MKDIYLCIYIYIYACVCPYWNDYSEVWKEKITKFNIYSPQLNESNKHWTNWCQDLISLLLLSPVLEPASCSLRWTQSNSSNTKTSGMQIKRTIGSFANHLPIVCSCICIYTGVQASTSQLTNYTALTLPMFT